MLTELSASSILESVQIMFPGIAIMAFLPRIPAFS
jgi:hypothetical protein